MSTGGDAEPGLAEALALWATLAVLCALAWITYARLPAREFYNVTGTGVRAGASRMLVLLGWPISIIAIALLAVAVDRLLADDTLGRGVRRVVVVCAWVSFGLCLTIVWPGVVNQDDLDAKPSNALAAIGVGLALALTLWALARNGVGRSPGLVVGDHAAAALVAILLVAGIPWLFAHVGVYVGDVPGLRAIFMSKTIIPEAGHPHLHAVHLGNHEGLDGILIVATALALSRQLGLMRPTRLRTVLSGYLAVALCYGLGVAIQDAWHEQLVKRGWLHTQFPNVIRPELTPAWGGLVVCAVLVHRFAIRPRQRQVAAAASGPRVRTNARTG
jgi:hypothetical protein